MKTEKKLSIDAREEKKDVICAKLQLLLQISGERNVSCKYDSDVCESIEPLRVRGSQCILEVKGIEVSG